MARQEDQASQKLPGRVGSIGSVFKVRPFLFLWGSQILSQIAFNILSFTLALRIYELTARNTAVSVLILLFLLPQLVLSLFAGVFVDRIEKKVVMLLTNLVRAAALVLLIFVDGNLVSFYVAAFVVSLATQFFIPAEAPMIPRLLPKKLLLPANSLFAVTLYGSIVVGYIIAGPLLKFLGETMVFSIVASFFALAAFLNLLLPTANDFSLERQARKFFNTTFTRIVAVVFNDVGEVLYGVIRSKIIFLAILYLTISQAVINIVGVLVPGYAATVLGIDVEDSSLVFLAPAALGIIIGSFGVSQLGRFVDKRRLIVPSVILSGIALFLLPFFSLKLLFLVLVLCFLLGLFDAAIFVPANTIIQEKSSASIRGRIYGLFNTLTAAVSIVPVVLAGYFSDVFGVGAVLTFIAVMIIVFGFINLVGSRASL